MAHKEQAAIALQVAAGGCPFTFTTATLPIYGSTVVYLISLFTNMDPCCSLR